MNTATAPSRISIIIFLAIGLAIGFAALGLGAAWADAGAGPGTGSGSGSAIGSTITAPAASPSINTEDAGGLAKGIYDAARDGRYKVAVGFLLMLMVFLLRTYVLAKVAWLQTKIGGITLAISTATASTIGLALVAGVPIRAGDVLNALGTALTAAGAWEWMKDLIKKKTAEPTPPAARVA